MKARIDVSSNNSKVSFENGVLEVETDHAFPQIYIKGIKNGKSEEVSLNFYNGLDIAVVSNGWEVHISKEDRNSSVLIVQRFKRDKESKFHISDWQYFTKDGKWLPEPKGIDPLPRNALRIPVFEPEERK